MFEDFRERIRDSVTVWDVAEYYGFEVNRRSKKMLCPFHNEKRPSCSVYDRGRKYHCFSCGAHGDVFSFVMGIYGCGFVDACKRINDDFHLGLKIGGWLDEEEYERARKEFLKRQAELQERKEKLNLLEMIYTATYNRFAFLDILKETYKPNTPNEEFRPEYIYACKHIDMAWNDVKEAERNLDVFIKKKGDN